MSALGSPAAAPEPRREPVDLYKIPSRVCMVCFDAASSPDNPLLCCSVGTCHVRVHATCYTVPDSTPILPTAVRASWVCDVCVIEKNSNALVPNVDRVCTVCKHKGGLLKPTTDPNALCHLVCARWLPELKQVPSDAFPQACVVDTKLLYGTRSNLKCFVCNKRGGCIQCSSKRCPKSYHALCAVRAPATKVFTGLNTDGQCVCHCETHLADAQPSISPLKDLHWATPYDGEHMYDPDAVPDPSASPETIATATIAPAPTPTAMPTDVPTASLMPFMNMPPPPPPPKKVGRPRLHDPKPSSKPQTNHPKPSLPLPPGMVPGMQGMAPPRQPPPRQPPPPTLGMVSPSLGMLPPRGLAPPAPGGAPRPLATADVQPCPFCKDLVLRNLLPRHINTTCKKNPSLQPSPAPTPPKPVAGAVPSASKAVTAKVRDPDAPKRPRGRPPKAKPELKVAAPTHVPTVVRKHATSALFPLSPRQLPADPVADLALASLHATLPSDSLFATWPGQQLGHLMQSAFFWEQLTVTFFSKYPLQKKRLEPVAHWLCGAKPDGMEKPRALHDKPRCVDTVAVTSSEDWIAQTGQKHTCDYMLLASGTQCAFDGEVHPFLHVHALEPAPATDGTTRVRATLVVHSTAVRATLALSETEPPAGSSVMWSRFKADACHDLLSNAALALPRGTKLWVALEAFEPVDNLDIAAQYSPGAAFTGTQVQDDTTLELQLCMDLLNEQMKANRNRWRALWSKGATYMQAQEAALQTAGHIEGLHHEYAWWKAVCLCMIKGTADLPLVSPGRVQPFEEGTCVICFDGVSEDSNPIIFCEACDIAVHQRCYGVADIPKHDFYCDKCVALRKAPALVFCQLCPLRDGALKQTKEGLWVHVACALWSPAAQLAHIPRMLVHLSPQPIVRFASYDPATAMTLPLADVADLPPPLVSGGLCALCRVATGCTVCCRAPGCGTAMHALCAWYAGLHLRVAVAACGYVHVGGGQGLTFDVFCPAHQPAALPCQDRALQRDARHALRLVEAAKRAQLKMLASDADAVCGVCAKPKLPPSAGRLLPMQVFVRCRLCSVVAHPLCCKPALPSLDELGNDWTCEKCVVNDKAAAAPCALCERVGGYMLPARPPAASTAVDFVHLYCAKVFSLTIHGDDAHGRFVLPPPPVEAPATKCTLCGQRSGRLVACWKKQCTVSFHPYCHMLAKLYSYKPKNKTERAYCCAGHPPAFAVFDDAKQLWITKQEIMALQQIRCNYERTRMFVDLTKQREKTKKRLFLQTEVAAFEKAKEVVAVVRPSRTMKTFYASVTGDDDLRDVTRRIAKAKPLPPPPKGPRKKRPAPEARQEALRKQLGEPEEPLSKRRRRSAVGDDADAIAAWWARAASALPKRPTSFDDTILDAFPELAD
ncbi:kinesin-like protein [Achlya hypogyna]|uniref:Kinesin-like protein n=1 Tax=Achlya hypogyna TaxID=1202772 RepID=A0A1V9YGY2_ACHHY|nr:kinesin-like protein [Achlya hypogyna]